MKKITLILALVSSMSMFATRYLVQTGAEGAATWRAASEGEVVVDLTVEGKNLNQWLFASFETSFPVGNEVWLITGTYPVTSVYNIQANFAFYGGFAGTETSIEERAIANKPWEFVNESVIDGGSATVLYGCASNRVALFDGITFKNGYVSGNSGALMTRVGVVVKNSRFIDNVATGQGGAILMNTGGEIYNSYFYGNSAAMGGAVHMGGTSLSLVADSWFENNKTITGSNLQGGAIRSQSSNSQIKNSYFVNNTANGNGSAIYTQVDVAAGNKISNCVFYGNNTKSALYLRGAEVINSTIVENPGGGVYMATKDAQIYNSVFWGSTQSRGSVSGVDVAGIVFSNSAAYSYPAFESWNAVNNVKLDTLATEANYPYFANPIENDWQITYQSPLLDAASSAYANAPATDINGLARPQGSSLDIGAYELAYFTATVTFNAGGSVNAITSGDVISEPKGKPVSYTITADNGKMIASVLYNDVEVKDQMEAGVFTAPALTGNATLVVTFADDTSTAINSAAGFMAFSTSNTIELRGLNAGDEVVVYHTTGAIAARSIASANELSLNVAQGIYLVKVAGSVHKMIVR